MPASTCVLCTLRETLLRNNGYWLAARTILSGCHLWHNTFDTTPTTSIYRFLCTFMAGPINAHMNCLSTCRSIEEWKTTKDNKRSISIRRWWAFDAQRGEICLSDWRQHMWWKLINDMPGTPHRFCDRILIDVVGELQCSCFDFCRIFMHIVIQIHNFTLNVRNTIFENVVLRRSVCKQHTIHWPRKRKCITLLLVICFVTRFTASNVKKNMKKSQTKIMECIWNH